MRVALPRRRCRRRQPRGGVWGGAKQQHCQVTRHVVTRGGCVQPRGCVPRTSATEASEQPATAVAAFCRKGVNQPTLPKKSVITLHSCSRVVTYAYTQFLPSSPLERPSPLGSGASRRASVAINCTGPKAKVTKKAFLHSKLTSANHLGKIKHTPCTHKK